MFDITPEQDMMIREWMAQHEPVDSVIEGRYTYCFTPTSVGTVLKVKDAVTKDEINVTEYHLW